MMTPDARLIREYHTVVSELIVSITRPILGRPTAFPRGYVLARPCSLRGLWAELALSDGQYRNRVQTPRGVAGGTCCCRIARALGPD